MDNIVPIYGTVYTKINHASLTVFRVELFIVQHAMPIGKIQMQFFFVFF